MSVKKVRVDNGELPISRFRLKYMVKDPSIVMVAKRGSGKSWVCRNILKYLHRIGIPGGMVIAKTEKMNPFYSHFFPDLYIHYEYKTEILEKCLFRQEKMMDKRESKSKHGKKVNPRAFLVMDDCLASKTTWAKDKPIQEIFYNGRHYKLTFILTMQFPLGIGPELRCNFDYIFLLADDFISNQKRLFDHYAGMFPNFDSFRSVYAQLTQNFGCMVIANRGSRSEFLDKVFYFKATHEDDDMIGSKQFIKFNDYNYNKDWNKSKKAVGIEELALRKKKNGDAIKVTLKD